MLGLRVVAMIKATALLASIVLHLRLNRAHWGSNEEPDRAVNVS